jgi:hypothetical protein
MSTKPTELEVSYAILLKLTSGKEEAQKLIGEAREALKSEPVKLTIKASDIARTKEAFFPSGSGK